MDMPDREIGLCAAMRACPLFADLPDEAFRPLVALIRVRTVERGAYVFRENDPADGFYIVRSGVVNVHRVSASGREQVIHLFRPGESFGEACLVGVECYPADARAVETSDLLMIPRQEFIAIIGAHPELAMRMLAAMSRRLRDLLHTVEYLTPTNVHDRLIRWLLLRCPRPLGDAPIWVQLETSKSTLASELGMRLETLSRALARLCRLGHLDMQGRSFKVCNPRQLERSLGAVKEKQVDAVVD